MDFGPALLNWPAQLEDCTRMWRAAGILPLPHGRYNILEVACGPGLKSLSLARSNAEVRVTLNDFPEVLKLSRRITVEAGLTSQVYPLPGSIEEVDLPDARFDLIICGAIMYYFSGERLRVLLSRLSKAMKQGGMLVIQEPLADERKCEAEMALMAAFQLLLFAPDSQVRSFNEYAGILEKAGFQQAELILENMIRARKGGMFGGGR